MLTSESMETQFQLALAATNWSVLNHILSFFPTDSTLWPYTTGLYVQYWFIPGCPFNILHLYHKLTGMPFISIAKDCMLRGKKAKEHSHAKMAMSMMGRLQGHDKEKSKSISPYHCSLRLPNAVGRYKNESILFSVDQICELSASAKRGGIWK